MSSVGRVSLLLAAVLAGVLCATAQAASSEAALLRQLRINHALLLKYETDVRKGSASKQRLVEILKEESSKLLSQLPPSQAAAELLRYTEAQQRILAIERISQASEAPSPDAGYYALCDEAHALEAAGRSQEAALIYEEIAHRVPSDDAAWMALGHLYLKAGRFEDSEDAFFRAIQINAADLPKILSFYEQTARRAPRDAGAFTRLGYIYFMAEQWGKAEGAFSEALRLDPYDPLAANGLELIRSQRALTPSR